MKRKPLRQKDLFTETSIGKERNSIAIIKMNKSTDLCMGYQKAGIVVGIELPWGFSASQDEPEQLREELVEGYNVAAGIVDHVTKAFDPKLAARIRRLAKEFGDR